MTSSSDYMPWSAQKWVFNPDDPEMWRPKQDPPHTCTEKDTKDDPPHTRTEKDTKEDLIKSLKHEIEKRDVMIESLTHSKEKYTEALSKT